MASSVGGLHRGSVLFVALAAMALIIGCGHRDGADPNPGAPVTYSATSIAVGFGFACATLADGTAWCWGCLLYTSDAADE